MASVETTKLGDKGTIVLPQAVRELLGAKKGSVIAFVITDDERVEVRTLEAATIAALDEIGAALKEKGITPEQWMKEGRAIRRKLIKEMYDIDADIAATDAKTLH
ncbi:MAG: AbrB/MazE/SpoVT family DNA-binding domain-containing protein [Chloroflexi bacterium]|nr:AbrB/MazE/SpoVT family DNA-binding domain-containing protein [Chloroflexota bacterium]MCL5274824.1 AbrB/MazE/SpoVT family DNA-binding domain-containing protein [Chloroflexota bacterium]